MNPEILECYRILEIEPGASSDAVKTAYRELVQVWHPDRFHHSPTLERKAQERLKAINSAYDRLRSHNPNEAASNPPPPNNSQHTDLAESLALGNQFLERGEPNAALHEFNKVLAVAPDQVAALVGRSWCYLSLNQVQEAAIDSNRVWNLDPTNQSAKLSSSCCSLLETLAGLSELPPGIHVWPFQPDEVRKVSSAYTNYIQPHQHSPEPRVLLLYDQTFWGGAGHGLCLCEEAVYWKPWPGETCYFQKYAAIHTVQARVPNLELNGQAIIGSAFVHESSLALLEHALRALADLHRRHGGVAANRSSKDYILINSLPTLIP